MKTTRRQILTGTAAAAAVIALPSIPEAASIATPTEVRPGARWHFSLMDSPFRELEIEVSPGVFLPAHDNEQPQAEGRSRQQEATAPKDAPEVCGRAFCDLHVLIALHTGGMHICRASPEA